MVERWSLDRYRLLGCSGLRVSPLALGTMTFGLESGWGADEDEARQIFEAYLERGGNFIDTANIYTNGTSEKLIGRFSSDRRDRLVIATKYTLPTQSDDPNSGGNHRKSMMRSVEASLRRLETDYIDLLYLHDWDSTTRPEEILRAMDDLVRSGKVLYLGISNTPAWQISRMQAIADLRGWSPLIALQVHYNLLERTVERDLIPMAREMGLGVTAWSPLASGLLSGKYTRADLDSMSSLPPPEGSRQQFMMAIKTMSERGLTVADAVKTIAIEVGGTSAQVALAWTLRNPGVTSPIIGARTLKQLQENLEALEIKFTEAQLAQLNAVSAIELGYPHDFLAWLMSTDLKPAAMTIPDRHGACEAGIGRPI
jgi:aryl-alcohol dehydrogenase-like predicted oxidoreductase